MKIVLVGGGSHRYLGIVRSMLAVPGLLEGGEINLFDPAVARSEVVGRLAMKSPEFRRNTCRVTWGTTLDQALDGADLVFVVLMAGGHASFSLLASASLQHGFIGSDQLSPSGAMLALKGGPILMDLARRMERLCPNAWLVDFANPVAVLSAAVNNHTRIRCLGVCAGYTNHQWDLARLLYGRDEQWADFEIRCAGVNHMSFILPGSMHRGRALYELAAERIQPGFAAPQLSDRWDATAKANITRSVTLLAGLYRKYGYLVFSSEGDGLAHLDMEGDYLASVRAAPPPPTAAQLEQQSRAAATARAAGDRQFASWLDVEMDEAQWNAERPETLELLRVDEDIMVKIAKAIGGDVELAIATSRPNSGAVAGFKARTVLEYSQVLSRDGIRAVGGLEVPDVFQGLVSSLATHQTLLGDAIATRDPHVLFDALYSYPVKQDTAESKALWRALLAMAAGDIPAEFQRTREFFRL